MEETAAQRLVPQSLWTLQARKARVETHAHLPRALRVLISISSILGDLWTEGATEVENIIVIMPATASAAVQARDFRADGGGAGAAGCGHRLPRRRLSLVGQASPPHV